MSTLIDELEARKNDYIVVADLINIMAETTNSTPSQVVDYLEAHYVNTHLSRFYMDDYYNFDTTEQWLCELGENDAKTTYFLKADVMVFEPITKHGIFKDDSNDLVNLYQNNLDNEYLTIDEVITNLNNKAGLFYNYDKIRDLARKKKITPCFYFNGYVCRLIQDSLDRFVPALMGNPYTEIMTGYFTYRLLVEQIISEENYISLPSCEVGNEILIYRLLERQGITGISYGDGLALFEGKPKAFDDYNNNRKKFSCISSNEIKFSKQELDSYIASLTNTSRDKTPVQNDSELLAKLESAQTDNDKLNARLSKASEIYRQNKSEIEVLTEKNKKADIEKEELIKQLKSQAAMPADDNTLQTILDESHDEHAPDLKHAIQLWIDLYIHGGIKGDSHSSKANIWIRNNTNYAENANSSIGRIREIATPLKDFGAKRSREEEK